MLTKRGLLYVAVFGLVVAVHGPLTAAHLAMISEDLPHAFLARGALPATPVAGWGEVTALFFRADGKTAIAVGTDDNLHVYDAGTGKEQSAIPAHKDGVYAAALSPDGKYVATGGADNMVRLWDAGTLKEIRSFEGHTKEVLTVAFSPDGKTLASGGADHSLRTWDVSTGKEKKVWHGHELKVLSVAFSPDGKTLASGGICTAAIPGFAQGATHADQVRLWDAATGNELRVHAQRGTSVIFTPDGRSLAAAGSVVTGTPYEGGGASVLRGTRAVLASPVKDAPWVEIKNVGSTLALSSDGRLLAVAFGSTQHQGKTGGKFRLQSDIDHQRISLWETATGKEIMQLPEDGATVVAFSPDGTRLAAGSALGQVVFLDLAPEKWPHAGKVPQLPAQELDRLWASLANEEPGPAYEAIWTLSAAGKPAVAFLSGKLQPEQPAGAKAEDLLTKLDSDKYAVREAAFRDLKKLGPVIEPDLRKAAADGRSSPEVRKRVQQLLDSWEKRPASPEELRQVRSLQVLERIASADARAVVVRLSQGPPGSWLTQQAALAVKRLDRR